ncbi:SOS response-associated peptidase family protein [Pseudomonas syringae]|uniref:SOS response-associated peptidase family protein n=1 Tax=Pseudomonas syringae TaxID=317 RepID=UPI0039AF406C
MTRHTCGARPKDKASIFFVGLPEAHPDLEANSGDGFVMITADSNLGVVDIYDRHPLIPYPVHAPDWIHLDTSPLHAEKLASGCCRGVDEFELYPVSKAVGNVRNQGAHLIKETSAKGQAPAE